MGYTHYYEDITLSEDIADEVRKIVSAGDVVICDWDGTGDPIINSEEIRLNGDASTGKDHETFALQNGSEGFTFCKTARKPYDVVVVAILVSLIVNDGVRKVETDGTPEDWVTGIQLYNRAVRKLEPSELDVISDKVFGGNANFTDLV